MRNEEQGIGALKEKVRAMGKLAEDSARRAIRALATRDDGLASSAKEHDKAIDELEIEIDELAIELLVSGASAREVRLITVIMKIARNLERVGDEATTISRRAFDINQDPQTEPRADISELASLAIKMLNEALEALVNSDPEEARALIPRDKEIDALNKQMHRDLTSYVMANPQSAPRCLNLMVISKSLERIADHATNIAEDVVYLYEGRDIRHTGKGKVRLAEPPR